MQLFVRRKIVCALDELAKVESLTMKPRLRSCFLRYIFSQPSIQTVNFIALSDGESKLKPLKLPRLRVVRSLKLPVNHKPSISNFDK
jgi:hypothetical protein